jgi:tRNA 2-thiouridine synthesizing protein A
MVDRVATPSTPKHLVVDATGLTCPIPALRTQRALKKLGAGEILEVVCTDPMSKIDIPFLAFKTGDTVLEVQEKDGVIKFLIERGGGKRSNGDP